MQRGRLHEARARHVRHHHVAGAHYLEQPRHADGGIGPQFHRVAECVVQPAQQAVHAFQPAQRLQVQHVVAHREVFALHERQAQVAREKHVLEVGLAEGPRRQKRDVRRVAFCLALVFAHRRARRLGQRGDELRIHGRKAPHAQRAERIGKETRDDQPVFQRIAQARRRFGALRHHGPFACGRARQVHRHNLQILAARRRKALHRAQIAGVAVHQRGRQQPALQQRLLAVAIGHDGVEQLRALRHAALDHRPFVFVDQKRQQVERPWTRLAIVGIDVVRDVVAADLLHHRRRRLVEPGHTVFAEQAEEAPPRLANRAGSVAQLIPVPAAGGQDAQQRECFGMVRSGLERQGRLKSQGLGCV